MDIKEFSDKFDALLNSYKTSVPYGYEQGNFDFTLNEYEKSIYLTQAQESKVASYFSSNTDLNSTFEGSDNARKSIEALVTDVTLSDVETADSRHIVKGSKIYLVPEDLWFTIYESITYDTEDSDNKPSDCIINAIEAQGNAYTNVIPVTHDDFYRVYNNPFRGANDRRALRLNIGDRLYEVVSKYPISKYFIRYVKKPEPIILEELPDGLTIDGKRGPIECSLDDSLHDDILSLAVQLALQYHSLTSGKVSLPQQQTTTKSSNKDDED